MSKQGKKRTNKPGKAKKTTVNSLKGFPSWFSNKQWHIWGLFALGFLLYTNALNHEYALDDAIVIYDNMFVKDGISGIPGILSKDTFFGFFKEEGKANLVAGGRYRPLTLVMFAMEVQFFGEKPFVGHLFNGLYYGLTVVLLYLLMLQLFRPKQNAAKAYFIALATAIIFAVHPIHTEVVANIKGRDEIIALLGSLAAMYFSFRALREKNTRFQILAGGLFFLGLMSKENAITFLAVVPLAYYFFTKESTSTIMRQMVPFVIGAAVFLAIRFSVLGMNFGGSTFEMMNDPFIKVEGGRYIAFTAAERIATVLFGLGKYLQLLIAPMTLTHDYYPRQVGVMSFSDWQVGASLVVYIGLLIYSLMRLTKKDPISFAILYFLITISIVSNILFPVGTHLAERLLFMPSVGLGLALAILGYRFSKGKAASGKLPSYRHFSMTLALLAIVAVVFAGRTVMRNPVWKSNYTLFTTDINYSPNSAKLRNAVGGELVTLSVEEENETRRQEMLQEAVGHLNEALRIHPNYKNAYLLLGNAYNYLQQYDQSIDAYQQALRIDPAYHQARNNLGITYKDAGKYYGETKGELDKAINYLKRAIDILPNEYEVLRLLGVAHGVKGDAIAAVEYFTLAANEQPKDAMAWYNLGIAHRTLGNTEISEQHFQKAIEIDPNLRARIESGGQ